MLDKKFQNLIYQIVKQPSLHARFLNTLSFLEYIGARKIFKSLPAQIYDEFFLSHSAEEAFHSLFFKKLSKKVGQKDLDFSKSEMLASEQMERYMQNLDKKAEEVSQKQQVLNYLYTTWIVEKRALIAYTSYNRILKEKDFGFSLTPVLKDEAKHLKEMETLLEKQDKNFKQNQDKLLEFEKKEFENLLSKLEQAISH